jgi:hypothetical protein
MNAIYFDKKNLEGKVLKGFKAQIDSLTLYVEDLTISFYHDQECCEEVIFHNYEQFSKKLETLVGKKFSSFTCKAEQGKNYSKKIKGENSDHVTETLPTFVLDKKKVKAVWLGMSNGYYDENVQVSIY